MINIDQLQLSVVQGSKCEKFKSHVEYTSGKNTKQRELSINMEAKIE